MIVQAYIAFLQTHRDSVVFIVICVNPVHLWLNFLQLHEASKVTGFLNEISDTGYGDRFSPGYIGTWIKKLLKRCGIDKPGSCHLWRHSCATDMHRGGADIRYVQEMLGHARLETTQIYTHVHIEALREVHARTHPHGRLGPDRDMHGLLSQSDSTEEPETDFTSNQESQRINAEIEMVAIEHPPTSSARTMARSRHSWPKDPPEDDPPAGNVPKAPPRRPKPPSGVTLCNSLPINGLNETESPQKTEVVAVYGYRYYDPVTGRWPSRDPIGERGGINIYAFLSNFSGSYIDYLGLEIIDDRDFFRDPEDDFGPGWDGKDPNVDPLPRLRKKKRPRLPWEPRKRPDVPPNPVIPPIILPEDTLWGSNAIIRYTLKVDPFCIACCLNSSPSSIFSCKEAYATYLKHGRIFNHMVEGYGEGVDRTSDLAEINAKEDAESKIVIPKCYFVSKFEPIIYISFPIRIPSWNPI